ncbi:MAG: hypothetical protein J7K34_05825 [Flavobacteriaceae bacterium]|nr:hypothetical protein [Flavobacteriaceae bacterium]
MPNSLIDDLKNLAQEILQLSEDVDANILREKTLVIFEKLTILDYQNKLKISSEIEKIKKSNVEKSEPVLVLKKEESKNILEVENTDIPEKELEPEPPVDIEDLFIPTFDSIKEDMSQKEEFKDTVTIEETERFFERKRIEKIQKKSTVKRIEKESKQLSLHDKLLSSTIQMGLNDRIAFVNNLFNFSQADFNKVLSTLNDFNNRKEAFDFINYTVKPKYNWNGKDDLVERFLTIIERKYL